MNSRSYALLSGIVFTLMALLHLWRLSTGTEATLGNWVVPMDASWGGLLVTAVLAFNGLRIAARR